MSQISGPDWLTDPFTTPRFDIVAKVPGDGKREQVPAMLRSLLASRFKLQMHRDQKTAQVYALAIGKNPPKLQATAEGDTGASGCTKSMNETTISAVCHRMSSATLAQQVQTLAPLYFSDLPIVDLTGLKGTYDFKLEWAPLTVTDSGVGLSMFQAVERQLGLKLEKQRQPMELLVVDRCEMSPTEN